MSSKAIVVAAIKVADEEGLEAVSIRRIAAEMKARPMSLYDHIESKDGLLSLMEDEVLAKILLKEPLIEDWRGAVTAIAKSHYTTYLAHPWVVPLLMRHASFGANARRLVAQAAEAMKNLPLAEAEVWAAFGTVNDYVLGYSLRAVSAASAAGLAEAISASAADAAELAPLEDSLRSRTSVERLEFGLKVVLDGIERQFVEDRGER